MQAIPALPPDTVIGDYRILEVIGSGGFAIVYRARDLRLEQDVALKEHAPRGLAHRVDGTVVALPGAEGDFETVALRLREEARMLLRLQHPHIIRAFALLDGTQGLFLVSESVEGPTLKATPAPLDIARIRDIFEPVLDACDYLHGRGILHADITPGNLILNGQRGSVLIDFGLARPRSNQTDDRRAWSLLANPRYAPPEQLGPDAVLTPATDVYYLAGAMYFAVTGRTPHSGRDGGFLHREDHTAVGYAEARNLRLAHPCASDDALAPELYPSSFLAAIDRALDPDPALRPQTIEAFRTRLGWSRNATQASASLDRSDDTQALSAAQLTALGIMRAAGGRSRFRPEPVTPVEPPRQRPTPAPATDAMVATPWGHEAGPMPVPPPPPTPEDPPPYFPGSGEHPSMRAPEHARAAPGAGGGTGPLLRLGAAAVAAASAIAIAALAWRALSKPDVAAPPNPSPTVKRAPVARSGNGSDWVDISLFAPARAPLGGETLLQLFLHAPEETDAVAARAAMADPDTSTRGVGSLVEEIARGTRLTIALEARDFDITPASQPLVWHGRATGCQFTLHHRGGEARDAIVTAIVLRDAAPIGRLSIRIRVEASVPAATAEPLRLRDADALRYRTAFLSYSSQDRGEVLRRTQALRAVGIRCFQDVLDLVPGERWPERLRQEVDAADLFLLFWSKAASASPHVREEIGWALARHGSGTLPEIRPIVLEGPPSPPPPDELSSMHFDDPLCYVMSAWAARPLVPPQG